MDPNRHAKSEKCAFVNVNPDDHRTFVVAAGSEPHHSGRTQEAAPGSQRGSRQGVSPAGGPCQTPPRGRRDRTSRGRRLQGVPLLAKLSVAQRGACTRTCCPQTFTSAGAEPKWPQGHSSPGRMGGALHSEEWTERGTGRPPPRKQAAPGTRLPQRKISADLMNTLQTCSGSFLSKANDLTPGITYFDPKFRY